MKRYYSIILLIVVSITACDFGSQGEEEHIIDRYYIGWRDLEANRSIYIKDSPESPYGQGIVSGYVFAIGNNDRYIIAKSINGPKPSLTYYHIIDTKGEYHTNMDNNNYWEFSSKSDFTKKLEKLGIAKIEFNKAYREDPW